MSLYAMEDGLEEEECGRLGKSLEYVHWTHFARAVFEVFRENQARQGQEGHIDAKSDAWFWVEGMRRELFERVKKNWLKRTGFSTLDDERKWFPFSVDGVVQLYLRYRKRNPKELDAFQKELRL
jgi:hypothetical protein